MSHLYRRLIWGCVITITTCVCASNAFAQTDIERARAEFQAGAQAHQEQDYESAVEHFLEANRIAPNERLLLYIGQSYASMGEVSDALEYVRQYAASSAEAAQEVADLIDELERRLASIFLSAQHQVGRAHSLASQAYGRPDPDAWMRSDGTVVPLFVDSDPAGAEVFLDTTTLGPMGRTPLRTSVFVGAHLVIVELPHHRGYREVVDAQAPEDGRVASVYATLERGTALVDIAVRPISARLTYISPTGDQINLGTGGWEGELPAGPGVFLIQHAGLDRRIEAVLDTSTSAQDLTLYLDPDDEVTQAPAELGILTIRSNLAFAVVTVDRDEVGTGLGEFTAELTPGLHTIRVCQDGYECAVDNVRIGSGERQTWLAPTRLEAISSTPVGGIVTASIAAAAAGAGVFFILDSGTKRDEGDEDGADTSAIIAYSSFGVAAALAVTSIVLFAGSGPDNSAQANSVPSFQLGAAPTSDGWGISFGGQF